MKLTHLVILLALIVTEVDLKGDGVDDSPQARTLFIMADLDNDDHLTYGEFLHLFRDFDGDGNGNITSAEFLAHWEGVQLGSTEQGLRLFLNLDVNKDLILEISLDIGYVFAWFDTNGDMKVTEGEFVIQWVKIST